MSITYMAIDKDESFHNREREHCLKRGIRDFRVDSMNEGIEKAMSSQFIFIAINADNICFMPKLMILRGVTNAPILIGTSNFDVEEQLKALSLGADFYGRFSSPLHNLEAALMVTNKVNEQASRCKNFVDIILRDSVLVAPTYHKAFIEEKELFLTITEMRILYYLMVNCGCVITYKQIRSRIWKDEYNEFSHDNLYSVMKRMRKKMRKISQRDFIETVRDVGYRFRHR